MLLAVAATCTSRRAAPGVVPPLSTSQTWYRPFPPLPCAPPQVYEDFACNVAAMPVIAGRKSRIESFAGANCTYTIEAMMGDRKALQVQLSSSWAWHASA